jgi:hypothetical protein
LLIHPVLIFHKIEAPLSDNKMRILSHSSFRPFFCPPLAYFNDLYRFNPISNAWTALGAASPPAPRAFMGFAATPDGMLYGFGGFNGGEKTGGEAVQGPQCVE